jgi:SAM-dependent methyltransferase
MFHGTPEEDLRNLLLQYRRENWNGIQTPETQAKVVSDILHGDASALLQRVEPYIRLSEQSRILDLGSGVGCFVAACRKKGLRCFGVEPDRIGNGAQLTSIQIARRRVDEQVFVAGVGEMLPFAHESFDLVAMNQVIEHVCDQRAVVREAVRVLKPEGVLYLACPNYLRFYEPHYKIFWIPLLPKPLGRLYLRLRGRRSVMIDQITYTTNARLRIILSDLGPGRTVLDLHREQFLEKRAAGSFVSRKMKWVSRLTRVPLVESLLLRLVLWLVRVLEGGCEFVVVNGGRTSK